MIADSRPSRFNVNVPVVSASTSNWQVLHLVWCSLQEFSKKVKNYSRKSRWFTNHAKVNAYFTDHGKIENSFPRTEKYRFTNHGKNKSSFTLHAKQKWPFTRHEKSIGDPHICVLLVHIMTATPGCKIAFHEHIHASLNGLGHQH